MSERLPARGKAVSMNKGVQKKAKLPPVGPQDHFDAPGPSQPGGGSSWYRNASFEDVLDDLSRHWFYEDFIREESPSLPSFSLKKFSELFFRHCPILSEWSAEHERAFERFMKYKQRVPCVLVKGWKASATWGFPRGKINNEEPKATCAVREVLEETGYNCAALLNPEDFIEVAMNDQRATLYIVPGVSEDVNFMTQTRKEISAIEWVKLSDLPTWRKQKVETKRKFYMIAPFVSPLKQWIKLHKEAHPLAPVALPSAPPDASSSLEAVGLPSLVQETLAIEGPAVLNTQVVARSIVLEDLFRRLLPPAAAIEPAKSTASPTGQPIHPNNPPMDPPLPHLQPQEGGHQIYRQTPSSQFPYLDQFLWTPPPRLSATKPNPSSPTQTWTSQPDLPVHLPAADKDLQRRALLDQMVSSINPGNSGTAQVPASRSPTMAIATVNATLSRGQQLLQQQIFPPTGQLSPGPGLDVLSLNRDYAVPPLWDGRQSDHIQSSDRQRRDQIPHEYLNHTDEARHPYLANAPWPNGITSATPVQHLPHPYASPFLAHSPLQYLATPFPQVPHPHPAIIGPPNFIVHPSSLSTTATSPLAPLHHPMYDRPLAPQEVQGRLPSVQTHSTMHLHRPTALSSSILDSPSDRPGQFPAQATAGDLLNMLNVGRR